MKKLIFALVITFLAQQVAFAQQAWTSPKGKFYSQIGLTVLSYDGFINAKDEVAPLNRNIVHNSIQGYLQYGITDKLMVTTIVPFSLTKSSPKGTFTQPVGLKDGSLNAFSNLQLGLTYRFYEKKGWVVSGKINAVLPTAQKDTATGLRSGDDALGIEPSFLIGFGHAKFFTSLGIGYVYRTNNYSSQSLLDYQIGKYFGKNKRLLGIFHVDLRYGNKNGTYKDGNSKYTASYLNDLRYVSFGTKFGYKITEHLMTWADLRFAPFASENIGSRTENAIPGLTFSVSYHN